MEIWMVLMMVVLMEYTLASLTAVYLANQMAMPLGLQKAFESEG